MRIQIYQDNQGWYRWRRRSDNGRTTSTGQAHRFKWNAKRAARRQFPYDPIEDLTKGSK